MYNLRKEEEGGRKKGRGKGGRRGEGRKKGGREEKGREKREEGRSYKYKVQLLVSKFPGLLSFLLSFLFSV